MRTILRLVSSVGVALLLFVSIAVAQQQTGPMPMMGWPMMGWPMMLFMALFWVLLLILMALAILWLIKELRK